MIRRIALATVAVTAAALAPAITWSPAANAVTPALVPPADSSVSIPLGQFQDMAVDRADKLVFYAGVTGSTSATPGGLAVSDLDGAHMHRLAGIPDSRSVVQGPDGQIYVGEQTNQIAVIDPVTLQVSKTWSVGNAKCPDSLAFAGAELWFSYSCDFDNTTYISRGGLAELNLDDGTVTTSLVHLNPYRGQLSSVPNHPDRLIASDLSSGGDIDAVSVSGTTATVAAELDNIGPGDLDVSPDGETLLVRGQSYSTADLSTAGRPTWTVPGYYVFRSAYSEDGSRLALESESNDNQLLGTYTTADQAAIRSYLSPRSESSSQSTDSVYHGVAWVGGTVLDVGETYYGENPILRVRNSALQAPITMSLSGPAAVGRTAGLTLTGQLPADLTSVPVTISRTDQSGTTQLATVTTDGTGKFSYSDAPGIGGTNIYTASYAGDQTHAPVSKTWNVAVSRQTVAMSLTLDHASYSYHQIAHLAIHVASHNQKTVQVWAKFGHEPLHLLRNLTLDSRGVARMDSMLTYDTVYQLRFAGDYVYNPRILAATAYTRVAIAGGLNGYYGSAGAYRLFHAGGEAIITGRVAPDKTGGCLRFESQYYWQGRWVNGDSLACARMDYASGTGAYYQAAAGLPVRTRVVYNTEATNLGNASGWMYLMFR